MRVGNNVDDPAIVDGTIALFVAGNTTGDNSKGGKLVLTSGSGTDLDEGQGGDLEILGGTGAAATGGSITLIPATSTYSTSGSVQIRSFNAGTKGVSGVNILADRDL